MEDLDTLRQQRQLLVVCAFIAAAMLVGALAPWPYGYYNLLRWVTTSIAVLVAILALRWKRTWTVPVFVFVAILFNPIWPVQLSRSTWQPIDIGTAVLFALAAVVVKPPPNSIRQWIIANKKWIIAILLIIGIFGVLYLTVNFVELRACQSSGRVLPSCGNMFVPGNGWLTLWRRVLSR